MAFVPPPSPRAVQTDSPEGFELVVPAKRNPFVLFFLPVWLVGWAFGEFFAVASLLGPSTSGPPALFLLVWLVGWTLGGGFAIYAFLWAVAGRERLLLRSDALVLSRDLLGFPRPREYELREVRNLRVSPLAYNPTDFKAGMQFWGIGGGSIAFDYGASTIRFGAGLSEGECSRWVEELKRRRVFPAT